jgi:hypothetical protein
VAIVLKVESDPEVEERHFLAAFAESIWNGVPIRWNYWVRQLPSLSRAQAARLMSGLDPDVFADLSARPNTNDPSRACRAATDIERLALAEGRDCDDASGWLKWCVERKVPVHAGFSLAVEERERDLGTSLPLNYPADGVTIEQAAFALGEQEGWNDNQRQALQRQMVTAVSAGKLRVRDPLTGLVYRPSVVRDFYDLVKQVDVNDWLSADPGCILRWQQSDVPQGDAISRAKITARLPAPIPRQQAQDQALLVIVTGLGLDPKKLPSAPPGKASKAKQDACAAALRRKEVFVSKVVFEKTWARLLKIGHLKYDNPQP